MPKCVSPWEAQNTETTESLWLEFAPLGRRKIAPQSLRDLAAA